TFITAYSTASGQNQLAQVSADDGRAPFSTHHSPPIAAARKKMKLSHWYSKRPLSTISARQNSVPSDRKKTVPSVSTTAVPLFVARSATCNPSTITNAISTSRPTATHTSAVAFNDAVSSLCPAGGAASSPHTA